MFIVQVINWSLLCINIRAVAHANYLQIALTDFTIASINFFVIKKIAKEENETRAQWLGYSIGGVCGSILGTFISQLLLGK